MGVAAERPAVTARVLSSHRGRAVTAKEDAVRGRNKSEGSMAGLGGLSRPVGIEVLARLLKEVRRAVELVWHLLLFQSTVSHLQCCSHCDMRHDATVSEHQKKLPFPFGRAWPSHLPSKRGPETAILKVGIRIIKKKIIMTIKKPSRPPVGSGLALPFLSLWIGVWDIIIIL